MSARIHAHSDTSLYVGFSNGELGAAPTLEFVTGSQRDPCPRLSEALWHMIEAHQLWPLDASVTVLTISDAGNEQFETVLTPTRLSELREAFQRATRVPARRHPAL
jgi:hypothetical protein